MNGPAQPSPAKDLAQEPVRVALGDPAHDNHVGEGLVALAGSYIWPLLA